MGGLRAQVRRSDEGWIYRVVNEAAVFQENRQVDPLVEAAARRGGQHQ